MAGFASDDGSSVYPSLARIAKSVKLSRRHLTDLVKSLVDKDYLIKVRDAIPSQHRATEYQINLSIFKKRGEVVKFEAKKLPTDIVDKCSKGISEVPPPIELAATPPIELAATYPLVRSIKHHGNDEEIKTVNKWELIQQLINHGVFKNDAIFWLNHFGYARIASELELMNKQTETIRNPGGYLRHRLNSKRPAPSGDNQMGIMKRQHVTCEETKELLKNMYSPKGKKTKEVAQASLHLVKSMLKNENPGPRLNEHD
jgi:hypothetical protein